jgi:LacI family transcriptional regulator
MVRVQRAIDALQYVPSTAARSLAAGRSTSVGLVLSDVGNSLFVDLARGAEDEAERVGFSVLISNTDARLDRERRALDVFEASRVAGILLTLNDSDHFSTISARRSPRTKMVLLNFHDNSGQHCSAHIDNLHGGRLAAQHLLKTGRSRIIFVGGPPTLQPVAERRQGFLTALSEAGVTPVGDFAPTGVNRADGWKIGHAIAPLVVSCAVDGVMAATDLLAAGIIQALAEEPRIDLPSSVGVIGYDNNQAAWDAPIPISTIAQPGRDLGVAGIRLLTEELASDAEMRQHIHRSLRLEPTLVERASTHNP